jgi:hypothetical protein
MTQMGELVVAQMESAFQCGDISRLSADVQRIDSGTIVFSVGLLLASLPILLFANRHEKGWTLRASFAKNLVALRARRRDSAAYLRSVAHAVLS